MNRLEEQLRIYMIEDALDALLEARNKRQQKKADKKAGNSSPSPRPMTSAEVDAAADEDDNSGLTMFDTAPPSGLEPPKEDDWVEPDPAGEPKSSGGSDKPKGGTKPTEGSGKPKGGTKPTETPAPPSPPPTSPPPTGGDTPSKDDDADKKLPPMKRFGHALGDYAAGAAGALAYNLAGKAYADLYRGSGIDSGVRMGPEFTDIGPKDMNIKGVQQIARAFSPFPPVVDAVKSKLADVRTTSRAKSYEKLGLDKKAAEGRASADVKSGLLTNFAKTTGDLEDSDIDKLVSKLVQKELIKKQQREVRPTPSDV